MLSKIIQILFSCGETRILQDFASIAIPRLDRGRISEAQKGFAISILKVV